MQCLASSRYLRKLCSPVSGALLRMASLHIIKQSLCLQNGIESRDPKKAPDKDEPSISEVMTIAIGIGEL